MKPLKEKISITIDNDILTKLKHEAEKDDRSLSQYINIILKQHITKYIGFAKFCYRFSALLRWNHPVRFP